MKRIVLIFLLLVVTRMGFASSALLLGKRGELIRFQDDGTSLAIHADAPLAKGGVDDACYSTKTQTLYCTDMDLRVFRVHPFADAPVYERIGSGFNAGGIMLDDETSRPVTLRPDSNGVDHLVRRVGSDWVACEGNSLVFPRQPEMSPYFLPDGVLSKNQLVAKCPYTSAPLHGYSGLSGWAIHGRNARIEVYGLIVADTTSLGDPFPNILLVNNSAGTTASVVTVSEYGYVYVYPTNIVVRAEVAIKTTEDSAEETFSGNYYVYDFTTHTLTKYELSADYDVLGASRNRLYLRKDNCVYVQPIGTVQGDLYLFATFDSDFEPFRVFPLAGD